MARRTTNDAIDALVRATGATVRGVNLDALAPAAAPLVPGSTRPVGKVSEAEFQRAVIDLAHACGYRVAHFRSVRIQPKNGEPYYATPVAADGDGFPDLLLAHETEPRPIIAAELKVAPNGPSAKQLAWLVALARCGLIARVWYPEQWDEIVATLRGTK